MCIRDSSVGDSHFKKKSFAKMQELISEKTRTVVIVSHNASTILSLIHISNSRYHPDLSA